MRIRTLTTKAALVMVLLFAPATVAVAGHGEHEDHDSHKGAMDHAEDAVCLLYTSPSPRDATLSRMPSSA